jgi:hypothetical protein
MASGVMFRRLAWGAVDQHLLASGALATRDEMGRVRRVDDAAVAGCAVGSPLIWSIR